MLLLLVQTINQFLAPRMQEVPPHLQQVILSIEHVVHQHIVNLLVRHPHDLLTMQDLHVLPIVHRVQLIRPQDIRLLARTRHQVLRHQADLILLLLQEAIALQVVAVVWEVREEVAEALHLVVEAEVQDN